VPRLSALVVGLPALAVRSTDLAVGLPALAVGLSAVVVGLPALAVRSTDLAIGLLAVRSVRRTSRSVSQNREARLHNQRGP
jgi:hypothetical protein